MLTVAGRSTFGHVVRRTGVEIHVHLLLVAHVACNTRHARRHADNRRSKQWCIAKNRGGYTLEMRRRRGCPPLQPTRRSVGALWAPPAGSGVEPRPPTHSRHISASQKPSSRRRLKFWGPEICLVETMHYGVYGIVYPRIPCFIMTNEVIIRCQKNTRGWYTAYTRVYPQYTPGSK